ncbi:MAG: DNA topoisomerase I, partial [Candidatus Nanoarchaeia archaeon]
MVGEKVKKKARKTSRKKSKKKTSKKNKKKAGNNQKEEKSHIKANQKPAGKKTGNSTLIITEKPAAAAKLASALSNNTAEKRNEKGVAYYSFNKDGEQIYIGFAVGHLFGLKQKGKSAFPTFDIEWVPSYQNKATYTKKYYDVLSKLARKANQFVVASDYDVEGEVIGWNVIRFICKQEDAKRMKFSSLTKQELEQAYKSMLPTINWGQAIAGETRHYLDWFYGINLSRGLMKALSKAGRFRILSIGRVQGPTLKILADRELEIRKFKPEPFWQVFLLIKDIKGKQVEVKYAKNIEKQEQLLRFEQLRGKKGQAETETKEEQLSPRPGFDLTSLQTEAYRLFGLTPTQTLAIAQQLYLAGLISYPRTSSQKLPASIGYKQILKQLGRQTQLVKYAVNNQPIQGKKEDPAHPAIYPTGETASLTGNNKKVYSLIMKRFIAAFCKPAIIENRKIKVDVAGVHFSASGKVIKDKQWLNVYPYKIKEQEMPIIEGEVDVKEIRIEEKQTQPPKRYTSASLVRELEKKELGTKATRSNIVETLYDRGYIKEKKIEVTALGLKMVETLNKHSPIILDEQLTRNIEKEVEAIQLAKEYKGLKEKEEQILDKAKQDIRSIAKDMKAHQEEIGKSLSDANAKMIEKQREENTLSECPVCKKGNLRIIYNRKYKRSFIGCSNYPECKNTYSLPLGVIKPAIKN